MSKIRIHPHPMSGYGVANLEVLQSDKMPEPGDYHIVKVGEELHFAVAALLKEIDSRDKFNMVNRRLDVISQDIENLTKTIIERIP